MADFSQASTKGLVRELMVRGPRIVRNAMRAARRRPNDVKAVADFTPFAVLEREGAEPVSLLGGYRNSIKSRWPGYFWPVHALRQLDASVRLPQELASLAREIRQSRTLPLPPVEVAAAVTEVIDEYPEHVQRVPLPEGSAPSRLFTPESPVPFAVIPTDKQVEIISSGYHRSALEIVTRLGRYGFEPAASRILEVGSSSGYMLLAYRGVGVEEVFGIDAVLPGYQRVAEYPRVAARMARIGPQHRGSVEYLVGDAADLPFSDNYFDAVVSISAFEHFQDVPMAMRETYRVLKPGGLAYHGIQLWFGPSGGHALCTLDFPWGHIRLSRQEFAGYMHEYRPHEENEAMDFYTNGFPSAPLTLAQMSRLVAEVGFTVREWDLGKIFPNHVAHLDSDVLRDCMARVEGLSVSDLMATSYQMVLAKD